MYTEQELRVAIKKSCSYRETLYNLGRNVSGSAFYCLKKNIDRYKIDISHFKTNRSKHHNGSIKKHCNEILKNEQCLTHRRSGKQLTRALKESGVKYECQKCGITKWNDSEIVLEVDHIDGDWKNNDSLNLRFLCPNCHSQTDCFYRNRKDGLCKCGNKKHSRSKQCTKCSKKENGIKQRRVTRPTKEVLVEQIEQYGYVGTAKIYGVTDNSIRKWLKT